MEEPSGNQTNNFEASPTLSQEEQFSRIKEICASFYLTDEQLLNIKKSLLSEIQEGLKVGSNQKSSIKCWPTFVQEYPCGCEHGPFLVLEIEHCSFHLSFVHLKGAHNYDYERQSYDIPPEMVSRHVDDFFDYLVQGLKTFLTERKLEREPLCMALCFSSPLRHTSLRAAIVQNLDNNVDIKNLVGRDIVELLQAAITRSGDLHVHVETVVSHSTAILLANSWEPPSCNIGINVGHVCNAVYVECVSEIEAYTQKNSLPNMIVGADWSHFGAQGRLDDIRTAYDRQVDEASSNNGQRIFEKLISGHYLGELARQIFVQCITEKVLFGGHISNSLKCSFSFTSEHVSSMLAEERSESFNHIRLQFDKLGVGSLEETECAKVKYILYSITQRAGQLLACGISSLSEKSAENDVVVGLGGSFYLGCHIFQSVLKAQLEKLLAGKGTFLLKSLNHGVAIGSALAAAISKSREFIFKS